MPRSPATGAPAAPCSTDPAAEATGQIHDLAERFLSSIRASIGYKKLYAGGHTHRIVRLRALSLGGFYKLLERMPEGGGLYRDPVLLSAVLRDTGLSADSLYRIGPTAGSERPEAVLSPEVIAMLRETVSKGVEDARRPVKQLSLKKRLQNVPNLLGMAMLLKQFNAYEYAYWFLFVSYSSFHFSLYPHQSSPGMKAIDGVLAIFERPMPTLTDSQSKQFGRILTLAYLVHEIKMLVRAYLRYSRLPESRFRRNRYQIRGFDFEDIGPSELKNVVEKLEKHIDANIEDLQPLAVRGPRWFVSNELLDAALEALIPLSWAGWQVRPGLPSSSSFYQILQQWRSSRAEPKWDITVKADYGLLERLEKVHDLLGYPDPLHNVRFTSHMRDIFVVPQVQREDSRGKEDGLSWDTAFSSLSVAVAYVPDWPSYETPTRILLAGGEYISTPQSPFYIAANVWLSGGWAFESGQMVQTGDPGRTIVRGSPGRAVLRGQFMCACLENLTFVLDGEMASAASMQADRASDNDESPDVPHPYGDPISPFMAYEETHEVEVHNCIFAARRIPQAPKFDNRPKGEIVYENCRAIEIRP